MPSSARRDVVSAWLLWARTTTVWRDGRMAALVEATCTHRARDKGISALLVVGEAGLPTLCTQPCLPRCSSGFRYNNHPVSTPKPFTGTHSAYDGTAQPHRLLGEAHGGSHFLNLWLQCKLGQTAARILDEMFAATAVYVRRSSRQVCRAKLGEDRRENRVALGFNVLTAKLGNFSGSAMLLHPPLLPLLPDEC